VTLYDLDSLYREQCEELRTSALQKRWEDLTSEREEQVRMKKELAKQRRDEEDHFARMWFADMESKARREEEAAKRQSEANRQTSAVLQQQMTELNDKKRQEKQLLEEQARLQVS